MVSYLKNFTRNAYLFLLISFFVPAFFVTNYGLNNFYTYGSGLADSGWFAYLTTHAQSWPLPNPPVFDNTSYGPTFFRTHFSLFFYLFSFIHQTFLPFVSGPVYFTVFIGSMYGVVSAALFLAGYTLLSRHNILHLSLLSIISIITSMNGASLATIGFPHIEIAIPALILLFIALYFSGRKKLSYIAFVLLLTIREDAGFHIFALLAIIILFNYMVERSIKTIDKNLIIFAILAFIYSLTAVYIQKTYFAGGDNALERIYLGNPHFAHLTYSFFQERVSYLLANREYLWVPMIFTVILSRYTKNIFMLSSLIAIFPWIILSFVAINEMPHSFSNYYIFPFVVMLSWPLFAFLIAKKYQGLKIKFTSVVISILLITLLSIVLFPSNKGNVDPEPWKSFLFSNYRSISNSEKFISYIESNRSGFGNILFDEPCAALFVKTLKLEEYGFMNNFTEEARKRSDTVIFYNNKKTLLQSPVKTMKDTIINNGLKNVYSVKSTNIVLATKRSVKKANFLYRKNDLFTDRFCASELPSNTGVVKGNTRIAIQGRDKPGFITFGPYAKLSAGQYMLDIAYASDKNRTTIVGNWDVALTEAKQIKILNSGKILGTNRNVKHIRSKFSISKKDFDGHIEIRNQYNGEGNLTIKSLTITRRE